MKKLFCGTIFLVFIAILMGCNSRSDRDENPNRVSDHDITTNEIMNDIPSNEPIQSTSQTDPVEPSLPEEDSANTIEDPKEALENLFNDDGILFRAIDDFDNDGSYEAFAFEGKTFSDGGGYGSILYAANEEITVVREDAVYDDIFVFEVSDGTKYLCLRVNLGWNKSLIYGVKDGLPEQTVLSDMGPWFTILSENEFTLCHSTLDGISLGGGHTGKPYYFYYDNGFHEYGATEISVEEFMEYDPSSDYLSYIEEKDGEIQSILKRSNHLIHVNYRCAIPEALQPVWQNHNLTFSEQDGILTLVEENDGTYLPAMVPEIAVYTEIQDTPDTTDTNGNDFVFDEENWHDSDELEQMSQSESSELLHVKLNVSDQSDLNVLEKFPNLKELRLTIFSDISLHSLALLPNLEKVYIYGEHASWYSLSNVDVLAELPFLQYIYIGDMDVSLDLSVFHSLEQLKFLSVQGVRSAFFSSDSGFGALEKLSIAETSCDLNHIPDFPQLKELSIIYCNISDEENIQKIDRFVGLEKLSLRGSVKENAPELIDMENLSELDICFEADYPVDKILNHKNLKKLTIREGMFSDEDLKILSDHLTECEINSYLTY